MRYRQIKPGSAVSQFVKCYWVLEDDSASSHSQTIVPDGRSELLINLAEPFQQKADGRWKLQPDVFFVGQITGPFLVRPCGPVRAIGVRFRPEGASRLLGLPMFEMTDSVVSLADISQSLLSQINRLREGSSLAEQLKLLEGLLLEAVGENGDDALVSFAVGEYEKSNGLIGVEELANSVGVSFRQFERRFRNAVGISPKLFSRMLRFQRVFRKLEVSHANWADTAISCGYYDQAHLIRDFRQFSGTTPTALLAGEFDLSRRFR